MINITFEQKLLEEAMAFYKDATGKLAVDVVNRAARNVAYEAMNETEKASKKKIKQDLSVVYNNGHYKGRTLLHYLAVIWLKKNNIKITTQSIEDAKKTVLQKRFQSIAYIKAGFIPAIKAFDPYYTGKDFSPKGHVAEGSGTAATVNDTKATIVNAATGATKVAREALGRAMVNVAEDMRSYAEKRWEEIISK